MTLIELLKPWTRIPAMDCEVLGLHNDSRSVQQGFLFFAYPGVKTDGRFYMNDAVKNGATAIIYEPRQWPKEAVLPKNSICIALPDLAQHLALIASRFYNNPTKKMHLFGVTGTNGKTTVAFLLAQAHGLLGERAAYIGTLGQGSVDNLQPVANTTPDTLILHSLFHTYLQETRTYVSLEVSSHALAQGRVDNIRFQQAIFTNLTLDHLDYHQSMSAYAAAKASLFSKPSLQWAIINHDDNYADIMKNALSESCQSITYGVKEGSEIRALDWKVTLKGTWLDVESPWGRHQFTLNALGFFNIYNALAVFTSLLVDGYEIGQVVAVMEKLKAAPGRMEIVATEPYVIVDYAHTPDALENVLRTLNEVKKGRIIVVFGCGGDRDTSKRPIMGQVAARLANVVIVTSDNPRFEDPEIIIQDILRGITKTKAEIYTIADRKQAIAKALDLAALNDIVLIAGKGHETYQQIGDIHHEFSDQMVVKQLS
jgi:UDP-N-acetylmuramoyl-L-alanyl-D-glutamate--2,6-diaminopimelate ligase